MSNMMYKYKIGDRVRFLGSNWLDHKQKFRVGQILTISEHYNGLSGDFQYRVKEDPDSGVFEGVLRKGSLFKDEHFVLAKRQETCNCCFWKSCEHSDNT